MYLDYEQYTKMGGTLDTSAFSQFERRAESLINAQASGKTGTRIAELGEIPTAITGCVFDLIDHLQQCKDNPVTSESQTLGGQSETYSYVTMTVEQQNEVADNIIYNAFFGGGIGYLLYRGVAKANA